MIQQVTRGIKIKVMQNFEGTFYRYIKLTEAQKNWTHPSTNAIYKPNK